MFLLRIFRFAGVSRANLGPRRELQELQEWRHRMQAPFHGRKTGSFLGLTGMVFQLNVFFVFRIVAMIPVKGTMAMGPRSAAMGHAILDWPKGASEVAPHINSSPANKKY